MLKILILCVLLHISLSDTDCVCWPLYSPIKYKDKWFCEHDVFIVRKPCGYSRTLHHFVHPYSVRPHKFRSVSSNCYCLGSNIVIEKDGSNVWCTQYEGRKLRRWYCKTKL